MTQPFFAKCLQTFLIGIVRLYQYGLSPWVGGHCRFLPTCSCYAIDALQSRGVLRGSWLSLGRLMRCHPGCAGGWDPVPPSSANVLPKVDSP